MINGLAHYALEIYITTFFVQIFFISRMIKKKITIVLEILMKRRENQHLIESYTLLFSKQKKHLFFWNREKHTLCYKKNSDSAVLSTR